MFFETDSDFPVKPFFALRVEVEFAFVLGQPLQGSGISMLHVLRATEFVTPALEPHRAVRSREAGHATSAGPHLRLPGQCWPSARRPNLRPLDLDLRWVGGLLFRNSVIEYRGVAAAGLNHPANGVA
jgi:2-oxo-hept-3-ene-1,7-dioate hydratase